jgi:2-polyprenyl-3-methyl-5-hydroxy-6-metoxy-1,4-benzoquinol methylase
MINIIPVGKNFRQKLMNLVLEHIKNYQKVLAEIFSILSLDGHVIITSPNYGKDLVGLIKAKADKETDLQIWNPGHKHYDLDESIPNEHFTFRNQEGLQIQQSL